MKYALHMVVIHKSKPAIVSGFDGDKIEITLKDEKKKVRDKDIELLHAGPARSLQELLNAKLGEADFQEAADFFRGTEPAFSEIAELVWGPVTPEYAWAAWQTVAASPWFECTSPAAPVRVRDAGEALSLIRKSEKKKGEEEERAAFVGRLSRTMAGKEDGVDLTVDAQWLQEIEALALGKTDKSRNLKDARLPVTPQAAHSVLLKAGFWKPERNPFPYRHGHGLTSAQVAITEPDDRAERLDLTALASWAIDNAWSADPDDAVSFDRGTLWVHIADPASSVRSDTPADLEARQRGATLYIPEGAARMLHDRALDYFALGLSPVSRALSFRIEFTETGAIRETSVHRTLVSVQRLTYAQASERMDSAELAPLFAIARKNMERRAAAGAVSIELPEIHLSVDTVTEGVPQVHIDAIHPESAADMVREMMLLAGEAAARFAFKHGIPFQYVSQESPSLPRDIPEGLAGEYRKRRSMKSRKVGTIPSDHAGLGLGMYSQVTSPLRRYGDLVAHQQLHLFLDGKKLMDTDEMLERIAAGDSAARECTLAERKSNMHWILVYLSRNPDWRGEAVIVELNGPQATVLIPELGQEARIPAPADKNLNDRIRIGAGNISIADQSVTFTTDA